LVYANARVSSLTGCQKSNVARSIGSQESINPDSLCLTNERQDHIPVLAGLESAAQNVVGDLPDKVGFLLEGVGGHEGIIVWNKWMRETCKRSIIQVRWMEEPHSWIW